MTSEQETKYVAKSMNTLKKLFSYVPKIEGEGTVIPEDKRKGYLDETNAIMIIPKIYFLKTIISQDFDVTERDIPSLDYSNVTGGGVYQIELLNLIMPLLKNCSCRSIKISTGYEYPITIETNYATIIVAPMNGGDCE